MLTFVNFFAIRQAPVFNLNEIAAYHYTTPFNKQSMTATHRSNPQTKIGEIKSNRCNPKIEAYIYFD